MDKAERRRHRTLSRVERAEVVAVAIASGAQFDGGGPAGQLEVALITRTGGRLQKRKLQRRKEMARQASSTLALQLLSLSLALCLWAIPKAEGSRACSQLSLVPREQWAGGLSAQLENGASSWTSGAPGSPFEWPPALVFVHHTGDPKGQQECSSAAGSERCARHLRGLRAERLLGGRGAERSLADAFNALVAPDGTVYLGLGLGRVGAHTHNYNNRSLGLALVGNYEHRAPSERMERALVLLVECASELGRLAPDFALHGHSDAHCTSCPGRQAYLTLGRLFGRHFRPGPLAHFWCPEEAAFGGRRWSVGGPEVGKRPSSAGKRPEAQVDTQEEAQGDARGEPEAQTEAQLDSDEPTDKRRPQLETGAISKPADKALLLINVAPQSSQSSAPPAQANLYLLTSGRARTLPVIALTSGLSASPTSSSGSSGGSGSSALGSPMTGSGRPQGPSFGGGGGGEDSRRAGGGESGAGSGQMGGGRGQMGAGGGQMGGGGGQMGSRGGQMGGGGGAGGGEGGRNPSREGGGMGAAGAGAGQGGGQGGGPGGGQGARGGGGQPTGAGESDGDDEGGGGRGQAGS